MEAHDSDVPAQIGTRLSRTNPQLGGFFTMLIGAADYTRQRSRVDVGATIGSAFRYYPRVDEISAVSHNAGIGIAARLPGQTTFLVNQTAAYSPSYGYHLFPSVTLPGPGEAIAIAPDYAVDRFESYAYDSTLRLTRGSSRGSSVSATGELNHTDWRHSASRPDLTTIGVGAEFAHGVARTGSISGGYRYRTSEFQFGYERNPTTEHRLSIGFHYAPALSITRRAEFSFNIASSTLDVPASTDSGILAGRRYRLVGDAGVGYPFRRTWQAAVRYRRALEYVPVMGEPILANGAFAKVEGFVAYRLNLIVSAGYSSGKSATRRAARNFDTYTSDVRLRYAWTQSLGVFAEYLYYFYDFRGSTQLAPGFPSQVERNAVRIGLVLWVPALGR